MDDGIPLIQTGAAPTLQHQMEQGIQTNSVCIVWAGPKIPDSTGHTSSRYSPEGKAFNVGSGAYEAHI